MTDCLVPICFNCGSPLDLIERAGRVEAFANKNPPLHSLFDGIFMGVGMLWTLSLLGGLREVIGSGTLFSGIDLVIPGLRPLQVFPENYPGFLLAILPPGAFILLGCLIAWKNWATARAQNAVALPVASPQAQ